MGRVLVVRSSSARALLCVLAAIGVTACAGGPTPRDTIEFEPGSRTADALYRVKDTQEYAVYLKPGTRLGDYGKLLVDPFMISYKRHADAEKRPRQPDRAYTLGAKDEARLVAALREVFIEELGKSRALRVVDEPGPEVLRVQGRVADLVVRYPDGAGADPMVRRELFFGKMVLILDVRDAETAEPLARVANRFGVEGGASTSVRDSSDWSAVLNAVRRWVRPVREALDEVHALPAAPPAPD